VVLRAHPRFELKYQTLLVNASCVVVALATWVPMAFARLVIQVQWRYHGVRYQRSSAGGWSGRPSTVIKPNQFGWQM
jgi:hypothetical protein